MAKKFEINLTPQNEEWIKLIPNPTINSDIVLNKLIEISINEGLLLEVISQSLTVTDLNKFKNAYAKIQLKRAEYMADLDVSIVHKERKSVVQQQSIEVDEKSIDIDSSIETKQSNIKKASHGWDEDLF